MMDSIKQDIKMEDEEEQYEKDMKLQVSNTSPL